MDKTTRAVADLRSHTGCQARLGLTEEAVKSYTTAYKAGESLPPIEVFEVEGAPVVVDGFHRVEAATRAGLATLPVTVVGRGTMEEAEWEALGKNHNHGVRRTREDKRKAVHLALRNPSAAKLSNRKLGKYLDVSHTFVANERTMLEALGELGSSPEVEYAWKLLASEEGKELAASCRRNVELCDATRATGLPENVNPPLCMGSQAQWIRLSLALNRGRHRAEQYHGNFFLAHLNMTHVAALVARAGGCEPDAGFWKSISNGFTVDHDLVFDDTGEKVFCSLKGEAPKKHKPGDDPKLDAHRKLLEDVDIDELRELAPHRHVRRLSEFPKSERELVRLCAYRSDDKTESEAAE